MAVHLVLVELAEIVMRIETLVQILLELAAVMEVGVMDKKPAMEMEIA